MNHITLSSFYDPMQPICFYRKKLPHMEQMGKVEFVTFRLSDSMPYQVMLQYKYMKEDFIRRHPYPWNQETLRQYSQLIEDPLEKYVDAGYGSCVLKDPTVRQYLVEAINHYDEDRYCQWGYVIMPNHVHMLVTPTPGFDLEPTIKSVMSFSARKINGCLGRKGRLWQGEPFDTLIRSERQYSFTLEYIKQNPRGLPAGSYEFGGIEFRSLGRDAR